MIEMKININNETEIIKIIQEAEKGCRVILIDYRDLVYAIEKGEEMLKAIGIKKNGWNDCQIVLKPHSVCNSYKGRAEGSSAIIKKFSSGWFLTYFGRVQCNHSPYGNRGNMIKLILSETAKQNLKMEWEL